MKVKKVLTALGSFMLMQGAASALVAKPLPYESQTQALITRVDSIELRSHGDGLDYTIVRGPGSFGSEVYNSLAIVYFSNVGNEVSYAAASDLHTKRSKMSSFCLDSARQAMATGRSFWIDEKGDAGKLAYQSDSSGSFGAAGGSVVFVSANAAFNTSMLMRLSDLVDGNDVKPADTSIPSSMIIVPPQRCGIK